ncbi:MAG: PAS domain-containing protein [Pseudomonadota bacterium]|nr:PAS domain-containing protein [Pseudomonadota bacterium]MDE3037416.1 PAS domain-containing protein [Pseudomonadota bacterium]
MPRYSDMDINASGARDFVMRKRRPTVPQLLMVFTMALVVSISLTVAVMDKIMLGVLLVILFGSIGWYVIVQLQRSRDIVLTTEFQNALFASALGINNKFCIIIKRDGNIVYLDRSFQDMFPDFIKLARRTVDILLEYGRVSREHSDKIYRAIEHGVYDKVIFDIRTAGGEFHKIVMSIEPIMRPSGFILLRGREFVQHRTDVGLEASTPPVISKSTIALFSHVMDSMNMGIYMAGPAGNIIYANPVLEQWLGYGDGEIAARSLSLQDIVQTSGDRAGTIEPGDYEGNVAMQKKPGGTVTTFVNQKIMRDEQGKIMGCTALVHNITRPATDAKAKLW